MATTTQSSVPPNSTSGNEPQSSGPQPMQLLNDGAQSAIEGAIKENSTPSVFVNSEPIREEQVQNAVKFLSHPKVRGSPVIYRRSFLERKGLSKEEIDEAFRRVPDPPPTVSGAPSTDTSQDEQLNASLKTQLQAPTQTPSANPANGAISKVGSLARSQFHWTHALYAVGLLSVSGAATAVLFKNAIIPRLKSWIRKVVLDEEDDPTRKTNLKPSLAEEAAAAAKAAAAAAADVAKASQEMLNSKSEEKRYFEEFMNLLGLQVQEMKSMSNSIQKLEGQSGNPVRNPSIEQEYDRGSFTRSKQINVNGKADINSHPVNASSASMEPSSAPHSNAYMEIMAMIQRGEKPPNIREINDLPPNPNQPISNPRIAPRTKPWEVSHPQNVSAYTLQSQTSNDLYTNTQNNGLTWLQKRNARITELETEDERNPVSYVPPTNDRPPAPRTWVPPQPPPVVMPEAAAAIRQPKQSIQKEQQLASDDADELQRITKISESGGEGNVNGGSSTEIQEEGYEGADQ